MRTRLPDDDYDEDTYKPRPQLPKPFVVMRSLAHLIKDLDTGFIDVDPEYQREVVWTAERMPGLINSLMGKTPKFLRFTSLNHTNGAKDGIHVCVDGKQRLSSVRAFIKGMIPCHDHRGEKWWFCDTPTSRRRKVLSEDMQKMFLVKEFVSFEFKDLSSEQEEDLFARVQMGVQLSLAEKMRASTGPWQELARLFVDAFPIIYSLMKDRARAKDFQLTLSCFSQMVEVMHPTASDGVPILKTNYNALPKLLSNKGAVDDGIKSHLASVWNTFKDLIEQDPDTFTNANKHLRGVQTFAPVEMVAVAVLISMYSETRNNQLLLGDIKALREAIRENFADIRMNAPVWKFVWDFLEDLEAIRGAVDGSTMVRRVQQATRTPADATALISNPSTTTSNSTAVKRGIPTARTKPPSILPPQRLFTVKKEEGDTAPSSDRRPPKRQRTDPGPLASPALMNEGFRRVFHGIHARSQSSSSSTTAGSGTVNHTPLTPTATPPLSTELRQVRVSEMNSYCAPTAPMPSSTSATSMRQPMRGNGPSVGLPGHQHLPSSGTLNLRTGIGAFTSNHTEEQWAGEVRSATPPSDPAIATTSSFKRRPMQKPRKTPRRPTPAQYDGAINLTSDTEQERQDLLSSFKAKTLATKQKQAATTSVVPPHILHDLPV
ncbi:hypothetical protein EK21DRAFT_96252 [Setomelanomma holmii]|uniref:GmrSD restriction endonucleases N-terminal domain-containing protein n=1 Tax=Setomelanomma holmii TaxID=210430 RepID=A0A9P4HJA7_9PLEO|nr:hypothetical protein EK21DRAFT_96252 [Setomelanomma holmii]